MRPGGPNACRQSQQALDTCAAGGRRATFLEMTTLFFASMSG